MLFSELGLGSEVLRAVEDAGYVQPTPIQEQAIPIILQGRDILGCAQTGTGKTASFTLPMIDILTAGRARARMPRSLILEPTRELAAQLSENFEVYGKYHKLSMALLIGGEAFGDQIKKLDRGVDVLIATPGRMIDLFERGNILLSDIKILVIDEADRMLDMGFIPDIERIVSLLPKMRQTLFFSATMPPEIRRLADGFLINPKEIAVSPPASPAESVVQGLVVVPRDDKRKALRHLLQIEDVKNALIFCNRKRDVGILHRSLLRYGFDAGCLHGDLPQNKRTETLEAFRRGEIRLLVCSDVAARGLDVVGLSHVFNFDVPIHAEDYVHRIGRTGRAGNIGRSFTLATPEDGKHVAAIAKLIRRDIPLVALGALDAVLLEEDDGERRRRGRSSPGDARKKGRSDGARRNERRPSPPAPAPAPATTEPVPAASGASVTEAPHPNGADAPRPRRQPQRRGEDRPRAAREEADHREPVVGFGDHLPAFLRHPARPTRANEA